MKKILRALQDLPANQQSQSSPAWKCQEQDLITHVSCKCIEKECFFKNAFPHCELPAWGQFHCLKFVASLGSKFDYSNRNSVKLSQLFLKMRIQKVSAVLILTFLHLASAKVDDWFIQIEEIEITKGTIHILHNFCVFFSVQTTC